MIDAPNGYAFDKLLAADALSETYQATDLATGRRVLARVPRQTEDNFGLARLRREAALSATLYHPQLARLIAYTDQPPCLVTEFLSATLTLTPRPMPLSRVVRLTQRLAEALDYLHAHDIAYVTLEPASIGLTEDGSPRLLNLGLAYLLSDPTEFKWLQANPAYIAPELVRGERPTPASDVYSLGMVVYSLLVGAGPFDTLATRDMVRAKAFQTPPPLSHHRPDLPASLSAIVGRAINRNPQRRYASASAFAQALAQDGVRRGWVPLVRTAAVAAVLLVAALVGERGIRQTPVMTQPWAVARAPALSPSIGVASGSTTNPRSPVETAPQTTAPDPTKERPIRLPFTAPVVSAAAEEPSLVVSGRGALATYQPEPLEVIVGAPLTITVSEPETTPISRPTQRQAAPLFSTPLITRLPRSSPLPAPVYRPPQTRPTPPSGPNASPPKEATGWGKPVADTSTWKRR